ncbi:unnamed protein product, partial [Didymodactylos carnosus]
MARPGLVRGGSVPGRVIESGGSARALISILNV